MSRPRKLPRKLEEVLGNEAADEMTTWMDGVDERHDAVRGDIAELRQEMHAQFETLRADMSVMFAKTHTAMAEMETRLTREMHSRNLEMMKWAIGFWLTSLLAMVGAVTAIARMAR